MKCTRCGAELNDEMAFCPNCGAAQNADSKSSVGNQQSAYSNVNTYQQQWQPQQPYQPQYQQQNNGYAQNNLQYGNSMPVKKKSNTPLIIALVAAVVIIIGLVITCIVLAVSKDSSSKNSIKNSDYDSSNVSKASTAEDTVSSFLDALLGGNYSGAFEYVLSGDIDYEEFGDMDLGKSSLKKYFQHLTGYEIVETEMLDRDDVEELNYYLDYSEEITLAAMVGVNFISDDDDYDDAAVYVVKAGDDWYIIGIDN